MQYGLGLVQGTLEAAMEAGMIERQPVRPLAHLLLGSIDEAGMLVARADDGGRTKREVAAAVDRYLDALLGAGRSG
jgi:hypothetical protein